jgi:hypothetical protein
MPEDPSACVGFSQRCRLASSQETHSSLAVDVVSVGEVAIVELTNGVRPMTQRIRGLGLMMFGVRLGTPRCVWSVANPLLRILSAEGCRSGHRKTGDQSDGNDKQLFHEGELIGQHFVSQRQLGSAQK